MNLRRKRFASKSMKVRSSVNAMKSHCSAIKARLHSSLTSLDDKGRCPEANHDGDQCIRFRIDGEDDVVEKTKHKNRRSVVFNSPTLRGESPDSEKSPQRRKRLSIRRSLQRRFSRHSASTRKSSTSDSSYGAITAAAAAVAREEELEEIRSDRRRYFPKTRSYGTLDATSLQLGLDKESVAFLEFVQNERAQEWAKSFVELDPRHQILNFFRDVAQEGTDAIEETGELQAELYSPVLRKYFQRSAVFSVWRPTSAEAIQKMILGVGTGKGLDIKGKSAKKGKLSSYVPFVQIHEERHKHMVQPMMRSSKIRVFYKKLQAREGAFIQLEGVRRGMMEADHLDENQENSVVIERLDHCAPQCYGLSIPEDIFWEAYVMKNDISRPEGSEYETGRKSLPSFQNMNLDAIRKGHIRSSCQSQLINKATIDDKDDLPLPVLWQYTDPWSNPNKPDPDPMLPQTLLMAYEEQGRVKPVVSDFDCFLFGTRGVSYHEPLPKEQVGMLHWMVSECENILDSEKESASWTERWLRVLRGEDDLNASLSSISSTVTRDHQEEQNHHIPVPRYGYGDPKSYSIIKCAVERLRENGAVRHGAECFNYHFPQEIDDKFLVISDSFEPVPYKYVNVEELRSILCQKVDEGYTFPLNPKWVLCDDGWKEVYDKLMKSKSLYVEESLECWFPKKSGLRERIENITKRHPSGFYVKSKKTNAQISFGKEWHEEEKSEMQSMDNTNTDNYKKDLTSNYASNEVSFRLPPTERNVLHSVAA